MSLKENMAANIKALIENPKMTRDQNNQFRDCEDLVVKIGFNFKSSHLFRQGGQRPFITSQEELLSAPEILAVENKIVTDGLWSNYLARYPIRVRQTSNPVDIYKIHEISKACQKKFLQKSEITPEVHNNVKETFVTTLPNLDKSNTYAILLDLYHILDNDIESNSARLRQHIENVTSLGQTQII